MSQSLSSPAPNLLAADLALRFLDRIHHENIGETSARILLHVHKGKLNQPTEIATKLRLTPSSIGQRATDLIKRGLIKKVRDTKDERFVTYLITKEGTALAIKLLTDTTEDGDEA